MTEAAGIIFRGRALSGYTLTECDATDSGLRFRCVVTGAGGPVTSAEAELLVEETPWRSAGAYAGGVIHTNINWTANTMGYNFTPARNGHIVRLGGFFNGTNLVSLWNYTGNVLLAEALVAANNNWGYTVLSAPVAVTAGHKYTVAVTFNQGGASYGSGLALPQTHADISINETAYSDASTGARVFPVNLALHDMYGQADVTFVRAGPLSNSPPEIIADTPPTATADMEWQYQVGAQDADGDPIRWALENAPEGMMIDTQTGLIRWMPGSPQVGSHPVTVHVTDPYEEAESLLINVSVNPGTGAFFEP